MDIVVVFDVSGSIDDQTPITMVKRMWNGSGKIDYVITSTKSGSPAGGTAEGTIFDIVGPPPTGTGFNGTAPQDLSSAASGCSYPLYFSENSGNGTHAAVGLRGSSDNSPPGNKPGVLASTSSVGTQYTFTDVVVNIDGNKKFAGFSSGGFAFPSVGALVEAARGNLESDAIFKSSGAATSVTGVTPKPGYKAMYNQLAKAKVEPIGDAQSSASLFFTVLNNDTNAHFGFIAFSSQAGAPRASGYSWWPVDQKWTQDAKQNYPVPIVTMDNATLQTKYSDILSVLPTTTAYGNTNIGDGLSKAVTMLKDHSRLGSKRAIVLFTDGAATAGGPLDSDANKNARLAAAQAKAEGIPIYAIGLAQTPTIIPLEKAILNDWNSDPATGGVAGIAGNGGKFFLVTHQQYLRTTFQNLAREFVAMVRSYQ